MSVSSVSAVRHIGRTADESVTPDGTYQKTLNEVYEVVMTAATDSSEDVLVGATVGDGTNAIPRLLDQHPDNFRLRVRRRRPEPRDESRVNWLVTIEYDIATPSRDQVANPPSPGGNTGGADPLDLPVKRSFRTQKFDKVLRYDVRTGDPVVTSVGRPFAEPVIVKRSLFVFQFVRNEARVGTEQADYLDKVNSETFLTFDAGLVYCQDITATEMGYAGASYFQVTYQFVYDPNGWKEEPLNEDMFISDGGAPSKWKRILDTDGREVTAPVPITLAGAAIPPEDLPGAAVFLSFDGYDEADFNKLGLQ